MVRWGGVVWALVIAIAAAVAAQAVSGRDVEGGARVVAPGLRLNEILASPARDWDGDGLYDSKNDEWIEIQNVGPEALAIGEYRLADAARTVRFALEGTLAPGEVKLITGSAADAWQRSQGLAAAGLSLNNSVDQVYLLRVTGPDTTTVDTHTYGSIEGGNDRSVGHASTESEDWILFDSLNRYTGGGTPAGTGCPPTPGGVNGCTTDVSPSTWGAIKRLYR